MSDSRQQILASIRRSLERGILSNSELHVLDERLANPPRNTVPHQGQPAPDQRLQLFIDRARQETATVEVLEHRAAVPDAVAAWLTLHHCTKSIVVAPHPSLLELDWPAQQLQWRSGLPRRQDQTSVTPVFAGIAETGTLCMVSGPEHPASLNLLPDNHIAVLERSRIVGCYEDCWDLLRMEKGRNLMPRSLLWITGPSLTGDIEQTLLRGAHGPRRLHILIL